MKRWLPIAWLVVALAAQDGGVVFGEPPFSGTIFLDPDVITSADPTAFEGAPYVGRGVRTMFDRRVNDWVQLDAYLFSAAFSDGLTAEIQVNPEFGDVPAALAAAEEYGAVIGQLPRSLRADVATVWIHLGVQPFGGGNNNLLIHTGQSALYEADGILEETLVHEAAHTSLDADHAAADGWLAAQAADGEFISTYARDNPTREDVAESVLPWLAVRHRTERIAAELADTIEATMPARIRYFDEQSLALFPLVSIAGDYNGDQVVDGADFLLWQRGQSPRPLSPLDLDVWRANYGAALTAAAHHAAPEPASRWLATAGIALVRWRGLAGTAGRAAGR